MKEVEEFILEHRESLMIGLLLAVVVLWVIDDISKLIGFTGAILARAKDLD